jgi:hypothetical protein
MTVSIINGHKVRLEKSNEVYKDHWLIEVDEGNASFHAHCKLYSEGMSARAEALSSDVPGDANRMDAWLHSLSTSDVRSIIAIASRPDES